VSSVPIRPGTDDAAWKDYRDANPVKGNKIIYLCGPINGRSDDDCKGWREYVKERISPTLDPMARDYRGRELEPGIDREIVENDKEDIRKSDVLLVYYDKPSVGTSMEVLFAYDLSKRIVLVDRSGKPLSPWLFYHCTEIYQSLDEAIAALA
jgi:nucleoside 2-deoxyribosyltransferase